MAYRCWKVRRTGFKDVTPAAKVENWSADSVATAVLIVWFADDAASLFGHSMIRRYVIIGIRLSFVSWKSAGNTFDRVQIGTELTEDGCQMRREHRRVSVSAFVVNGCDKAPGTR